MWAYQVYGLNVHSQRPLGTLEAVQPDLLPADLLLEFPPCSSAIFRSWPRRKGEKTGQGVYRFSLPDGGVYLRWPKLFEFWISGDGRKIAGAPLTEASEEAFQAYLLAQVISFALLRQGIEPLHATAVVVDGAAVGLLGASGSGKSCLAAAFLRAGYRLLTDDLLVVREKGETFYASPGLPRIKLFPKMARTLLRRSHGAPMNTRTAKLVLPLAMGEFCRTAMPLRALYLLAPPDAGDRRKSVSIESLSRAEAFLELVKGTFNLAVVEEDRMKRLFFHAAGLAARVPAKLIVYPRQSTRLPAVREQILADLAT